MSKLKLHIIVVLNTCRRKTILQQNELFEETTNYLSVICPPWQSPKLPLPADIRSRPEDDEEVFLLGHLDEPRQVEEGREVSAAITEVEDSLLRLVQVPRNVTEE